MLIMPELAVALRRELADVVVQYEADIVALSTWHKARPQKAACQVQRLHKALERPLHVVLWQRGQWAQATLSRAEIGGELTSAGDMETVGQLWLFDAITLPSAVKKRFALPVEARVLARILLPLEPSAEHEGAQTPAAGGIAMGYLFRTAPHPAVRDGLPFLRMLPDLYPGEFLVDPHVNFIAGRRYLRHRLTDVTPGRPRPPFGAGRILLVGEPEPISGSGTSPHRAV
jgi:hypothetical protein